MTSQLPGGQVRPVTPARALRRSRTDRVIGGVCGGLGRYLGVDPLLMRIAAVALALSGGAGVLAYIVAWIVIPEVRVDEEEPASPATSPATVTVLVGGVLLILGAVLLVRQVVPWFEMGVVWPLLLLTVGALVIVSATTRGRK
jgi:phage shock protein C